MAHRVMILSEDQHEIIQTWLHRSAEIIGINIQVHGTPAHMHLHFVVANHISWLDIINYFFCVAGFFFIESRNTQLARNVGTLAAKAGTLFIHRGSKNGAAEAV